MKIQVEHAHRFDVDAALPEVFALLADVPRSVSHFPGLDQLHDLGDNVYRWELTPISVLNVSHQVVYANRYVNDSDGLGVAWTPVEGIGNSVIRGRWRLEPRAAGTTLDFAADGELEVPLPVSLRRIAAPFVQRQFRGQVRQYLDNLGRALRG